MELNFNRGRNWTVEKPTSVGNWNGIIVMLNSGETGIVDVMFTGVSRKGNCLFAKTVQGTKVKSYGFSTSGSMCCTDASFTNEKGEYDNFYPGRLNQHIYSANNVNIGYGCIDYPSLSGIFYIEKYQGKNVCIGVDDPTLLNCFVELNNEYIQFKEKHTLVVGNRYTIKTYTGYDEATFITALDWNYGKFQWDNGNTFQTGINQIKVDSF